MIEWFTKRTPGAQVLQGSDDPTLLLIGGEDVPDWVMTPPEWEEAQVRVLSSAARPCPRCRLPGLVRHLRLDSVLPSGRLVVAECTNSPSCGFVWYRIKELTWPTVTCM